MEHVLDCHRSRLATAPPAYAAVDLGTNNCRLLVAWPVGAGFKVIDAFSRAVRLGEGMAVGEQLREAAMSRAIAALGVCARKMARRGVTRSRAVATEACRVATNGPAFLRRVAVETGLAIETIDSREEAALALAGCQGLLTATRDHGVLVDIGGGSTQIVWFRLPVCGAATAPVVIDMMSLPWGVVSLSERHDRVAGMALYEAVCAEVVTLLRPFEARHRIADLVARGRVQAVGTSGTITTLAGVVQGLPRYERSRVDGVQLDCDQIIAVSRDLARLTEAERAAIPCVGPTRAGLVVVGCAILTAVCRIWPVGVWRVADRGLREGILLSLMAADGHLANAAA